MREIESGKSNEELGCKSVRETDFEYVLVKEKT